MIKRIDITGDRYGRLVVLKEVEQKGYERYFLCRCDCGIEKPIRMNQLRRGKTTSCGCYNRERSSLSNVINLTDQRFGKLTVIKRSTQKHATQNKAIWECKCDCGNPNPIDVLSTYLINGDTQSCGCHKKEIGTGLHQYNNDNLMVDGVFTPLLKSKTRADNTTGVKGVTKMKRNGKYRASISVKGKRIYLGEFATLEEAANARRKGEDLYHKPYLEDEQND